MDELRPDNYLRLLDQYENGCERTMCELCPCYIRYKKVCVFDSLIQWKKWNKQKHNEFWEKLHEQNDKV